MSSVPRLVAGTTFAVLLAMVPAASAAVLTFDDVTSLVTQDVIIPNGYGGLDWDGFGVIHMDVYPGSGYANGTVSGSYTAFNRYAEVASASDGIFNFTGAYLLAAWNTGLNINVKGFQGATLLYDAWVIENTDGPPTFFTFNYAGIDRLVFESSGGVNAALGHSGEHFAMDNFTYDVPGTSVPEPSSLALLGIGLVVSALACRRTQA